MRISDWSSDVCSSDLLKDDSVGLGLRRSLLGSLQAAPAGTFDFLEAAPENWIGVGGALGEAFAELATRHPLACHGLSLSLGGPAELDETFLHRLRHFLHLHDAEIRSAQDYTPVNNAHYR